MIRRIVNFNIDANQISNTMLSYQGEHLATELRIHLPEKLLSSDCTYKLLFYLPNGEAKYAVLEYTKRYLKFLIPQALTMLSGSIKVQLIITDNDNTIIKSRTQRYTIVPSDNVTTKEVDDKYIGLLDGKIQECNKALETAIAQAKNAYQIAVENGFVGTESEWLESLKGQDYVLTEADKTEIANAALEDINTTLSGKADKATTLAGYGITDGENTGNKISDRSKITDENNNYPTIKLLLEYYYDYLEIDELLSGKADKATTLAGYGITNAYTKTEIDNGLTVKADLVQSKNIFDFDKWAKCLQSLPNPVFRGSLDVVDFDKKSITFTGTEVGTSYTNGWSNKELTEMHIAVKPNTVYTFSWQFTGGTKTQIFLFFNASTVAESRLSKDGAIGYITFTTLADTSYITIRFDNLGTGTVTVSEIMIEEGDKKSLYLPYEVAEGVKELAQSTEERLAYLENAMQDLILTTLGGE